MWWILVIVAVVATGIALGIYQVRSWRKPAKVNLPEGLRNP